MRLTEISPICSRPWSDDDGVGHVTPSPLLNALEETEDHGVVHSVSASSVDFTVQQWFGFTPEEDEEKGGDRELATAQSRNGGTADPLDQRMQESRKRKRTAAMHNLNERTRREKISGKMKELQRLVPCSDTKRDRASMLDTAISYMKSLQQQVQTLSEDNNCGRCQCQIPVFPQPSSFQHQQTPTYPPDQIMNMNMNITTTFMSSAAGGGAYIPPPPSGVTRWFPRYGSTFVLSDVHPSFMPTTMPFFVQRGLAFPAESSDQTSSQMKSSSSEDCHFIPVPKQEEKIDNKKYQFS